MLFTKTSAWPTGYRAGLWTILKAWWQLKKISVLEGSESLKVCWSISQNSKKYFLKVFQFMKGYDKGANELPDEEIHKARPEWGAQSTGALVPVELGYTSSPLPEGMCSPTWKLSKAPTPLFLEHYGDFLIWHDQLLTPFPAPPPSLEDGGWDRKFQVSNWNLVFLVTSPHPKTI